MILDPDQLATPAEDDASADAVAPRRGRPRDPERDTAILDAALELLVTDGYDLLTIERVATAAGASKATVYRRWDSKHALVLDALLAIKPALDDVDTGSLAGDIERLTSFACTSAASRIDHVMQAIASAMPREPALLEMFRDRFTMPRIRVIAAALERARDRGELGEHIDIPLVAGLVPSLMLQHLLMTGRSGGRELAERIVDGALLPALGLPPRTKGSTRND